MTITKEKAKKRLMYIQKEDYNFLTYILLLVLIKFDAKSESSRFRDFRKIAYLIHFINLNPNFNSFEKNELAKIYSQAQLKKQLLSHLLIILKNRGFIGMQINQRQQSFDVWINEKNIPNDFFNQDIFFNELENIQTLKLNIKRLKTITVKNLVDTIFTKNNIITWEV